jgi:hypothetical protein
MLAAHPERLAAMTLSLRQSATAALARAPLNVTAMRQLAMLGGLDQRGEGELAQYKAAEGITRRDLETEFALIRAFSDHSGS